MIRVSMLAVFFCAAFAAAPARAEDVAFPGPDGVTLQARLFKPEGRGPFPAIIALHGCAGPNNAKGEQPRRESDWRERWLAQGFLVIFPDSFGSRGVGSQCRTRARVARASDERAADALATRRFLLGRQDVKLGSINLVGHSNGAETVIYALASTAAPGDGKPDFARAVAFYPGCQQPARQGIRPRAPLLILIGASDNWTPASACAAFAAQSGGQVELVQYADAYHDFDAPGLPVREHTGLAYSADGTGRAFTGTNEAARADAIRRLAAYLAR